LTDRRATVDGVGQVEVAADQFGATADRDQLGRADRDGAAGGARGPSLLPSGAQDLRAASGARLLRRCLEVE
jgi:hypothetical protein